MTGLGFVDTTLEVRDREVMHAHQDVLVIGGGVAGLSAALAASSRGKSVLLVEEGLIAEKLASPSCHAAARNLHARLLEYPSASILENAAAIGIYEGLQVPIDTPDRLHIAWPTNVVVATGAVNRHAVFPNNDLPGIWLSRGAGRLAANHGLKPGKRAVIVGVSGETPELLRALDDLGVEIAAIVTDAAAAGLPVAMPVVVGKLIRAVGRKRLKGVTIKCDTRVRRIRCDALIVDAGLEPRDALLRHSDSALIVGAGDVIAPGCSLEAAIESGSRAGGEHSNYEKPADPASELGASGFICFCEDVEARDLVDAWAEGFDSTELLKRYSTTCMGPCQGALCHANLQRFVRARAPDKPSASSPTTARPPARPMRLEDAAAGRRYEIDQRTSLHHRHLALGASMERVGAWLRPTSYGDAADEYAAVRHRVSVMDVGTLGKFLVGGTDAAEFLERLYPCRVHDLEVGRARYALLLNEEGHVTDDGMICALDRGRFYLTFTSGGSEHAESWMRDWVEQLDLNVHLINETSARGAINLAGPLARKVLSRLTKDPIDPESFPYMRVRHLDVAGVPCIAIRLGFVGELSYELHHASGQSTVLWDKLLEAGASEGISPHGLDALRLLRLEKGHVIIGQDTDVDSGPRNLGLDFAVKLDKASFVGRSGVLRNLEAPLRQRLVLLRFDDGVPLEGAALFQNDQPVGQITSARLSPALGVGVALGWLRGTNGSFPDVVRCSDGEIGRVVSRAFYDPDGIRLRA
jgi:sarcosine oxidase subunit alpha